jgi:GT2 family glycosyltransferase
VGHDVGNGWASTNSDAMFFDPERHAESLVLLTSAYLTKGAPASAFPFADRRCRIFKPGARDYLLRAEASRMAGFSDYARADLAAAVEIDPNDPFINFGALSWGDRDAAIAAARRLIADENATLAALAMARDILLAEGERSLHRFSRSGRSLVGWIVWDSTRPIEIRPIGPPRDSRFVLEPDPAHPLASPSRSAASFAISDDAGAVQALEWVFDGEVVARAPAPPPPAFKVKPLRGDRGNSRSATLIVIVPVYEDFEATRACLAALIAQDSTVPRRLVVVDDASPNVELREYLDAIAEGGDAELIRNATNLGFAAAVNKALASRSGGDALLVNADAWLPPGAIDRLATIAHSAADIGTVTPLSNNGEMTSYPVPHEANPMPSVDEIREIDAWARRANGDGAVELPNGVGFCLYIRSECLDTVGPLSEVYLRGYYEDVEFCLKARDRGFRNVCATGIFVGHAGSLSFADKKRALVVRNLAVLELRYPGYRVHSAAFVAADPLKAARAAIDEYRPPRGEVILLASGQGKSKRIAELRARQIAAEAPGATILHCVADAFGRGVELRREGEGAPKSLAFALDGAQGSAKFHAYLDQIEIGRAEVFDAPAIPEEMLRSLFAVGGRVEMICGDLKWFGQAPPAHAGACRTPGQPGLCSFCGDVFLPKPDETEESARTRSRLNLALGRASGIRPLDAMGDAFARRVFKTWAIPLEPARAAEAPAKPEAIVEVGALGVLAPTPSGAIDRLVLGLSRRLARGGSSTKIVVIGRCVDDLALMAVGNTFVTGEAQPDEYVRIASQYGVGPLWLADRTAFYGQLDGLARATGAPKAYFDWSFGGLRALASDLSIDPRICDEKAVEAIAFWLDSIHRNETE